MGGLDTENCCSASGVGVVNLHSNMGGLGTWLVVVVVPVLVAFTFQYGWIGYQHLACNR